jgi:ABC-type Mn2+/Zn2+ transport system permease subunit
MRLALVASMVTGAALGVMGVYLVIRRVVFLGLVVANAATLGAALAEVVGLPRSGTSLLLAVGAAAALGGVERSSRASAESLMGWAYAAAAATTVLLLSWATTGSAETLHLLFGNVLAVQAEEVVWLTAIAIIVGIVQMVFGRRLLLVTFDVEAARVAGVRTSLWFLALNLTIGVTATAAVQSIGALPTFALLTLPSMAALLATKSARATFVTAAALGTVLPAAALVLSFHLDLPPGPSSVALLALSVPVAALANHTARRKDNRSRSPAASVDR